MKLVPSNELIRKAYESGYAVPSFCVWNAELAITALGVAERMRAPVLMMSGPGEFPVLRPAMQVRAAEAAAVGRNVRAAIHLDHGDSLELVRECLDAGYTGVMLDLSTRPYAENVAGLKQAVAWARPLGVSVEGEIGAVGKVSDETVEGGKVSTLTDPEEAKRYAQETGVDMLAVSIGNAHGLYTKLPQFDFRRLERIRRVVNVPLVLHGGSGTSEADIRRAIALGIAKINVASEICKAYKDSLVAAWAANPKWIPMTLGEALTPVAKVMEKWIRMCGAEGKAFL